MTKSATDHFRACTDVFSSLQASHKRLDTLIARVKEGGEDPLRTCVREMMVHFGRLVSVQGKEDLIAGIKEAGLVLTEVIEAIEQGKFTVASEGKRHG